MSTNNDNFKQNVGLAAEVIKTTLETFNLYIAVDASTKEFVFIDRDCYHDPTIELSVGRVSMEQINVVDAQKV